MLALLFALGLLAVGTLLLVVGADWFLDGAADLARALGVSALVLGVLLAGLEPEEMLTAAIASARGAPTLAVGNVIGTNVTIVTGCGKDFCKLLESVREGTPDYLLLPLTTSTSLILDTE